MKSFDAYKTIGEVSALLQISSTYIKILGGEFFTGQAFKRKGAEDYILKMILIYCVELNLS